MPTATDARETTIDAAKIAQDATRRYLDEAAGVSRVLFTAWAATAQAGLRTVFDVQNATLQASRTMLEAAAMANRNWFDQTADSVRKSQEATGKMVAAGFDMVETTVQKIR